MPKVYLLYKRKSLGARPRYTMIFFVFASGLVAVQEYLQKWEKSGWKTVKAQHRDSNAMRIVVSAVLPFLPRNNA